MGAHSFFTSFLICKKADVVVRSVVPVPLDEALVMDSLFNFTDSGRMEILEVLIIFVMLNTLKQVRWQMRKYLLGGELRPGYQAVSTSY